MCVCRILQGFCYFYRYIQLISREPFQDFRGFFHLWDVGISRRFRKQCHQDAGEGPRNFGASRTEIQGRLRLKMAEKDPGVPAWLVNQPTPLPWKNPYFWGGYVGRVGLRKLVLQDISQILGHSLWTEKKSKGHHFKCKDFDEVGRGEGFSMYIFFGSNWKINWRIRETLLSNQSCPWSWHASWRNWAVFIGDIY